MRMAFMVFVLLMGPLDAHAGHGLEPITIKTDLFKIMFRFEYGESKMFVQLIYQGVPDRFKRDFDPSAVWGADSATVKFLDKHGAEVGRVDFYMNSTCYLEAGNLTCRDDMPVTMSDYRRIVNVSVPA